VGLVDGAWFAVSAASALELNGNIYCGTWREANAFFISNMPQIPGSTHFYRKCYTEEEARTELRENGFAASADSVAIIDMKGLGPVTRPPKSNRARR